MNFKRSISVTANFTLIEILVVCAIIMILAGMGLGVYSMASEKMSISRTKALITKVEIAMEAFKKRNGYYPTPGTYNPSSTDYPCDFYFEQVTGVGNDLGDFLDFEAMNGKDIIVDSGKYYFYDAFGEKLKFRCPGYHNRTSFDIGSLGADGKYGDSVDATSTSSGSINPAFGEADDIVNW